MVGGVVSATVTLKEQLLFRPVLSTAVHVTSVVVAPGNWLPDGGTHVRLAIPAGDDALVEYITVAYSLPRSGLALMLTGHVMVGLMLLMTLT